MMSRRLGAAVLLAAMSACQPTQTALRVVVRLDDDPALKVTCVRLTVEGDAETKQSSVVEIPAGDTSLVFAIFRESLPKEVTLSAEGFLGQCTDEASLVLNAKSERVTGTFPEVRFSEVQVPLTRPDATLDADQDGYVDARQQGPDCDDSNALVFPGAVQRCDSAMDNDCDGFIGCDETDCAEALDCASSPDALRFISPPTEVQRRSCVPLRVALFAGGMQRSAVRATPISFSAVPADATFFASADCSGNPVSSGTIAFNQSELALSMRVGATVLGTLDLTFTAAGVAGSALAQLEVSPTPATSVSFSPDTLTLGSGLCSATPVSLRLSDAQGLATALTAATTLRLTSTPSDLGSTPIFFGAAGCQAADALTDTTFPAGQESLSLWLQVKRAGAMQATATLGALPPAHLPLTVSGGAATALVFANTGAVALKSTDACGAAPLELQLRDALGNAASLGTDLAVTLTGAGLSFWLDASCTSPAPAGALTLTAGSTRLAVYVKALTGVMKTVTVRASSDAGLGEPTVIVQVDPGDPAALAWLDAPQTAVAGGCSALPLKLELRDDAGTTTASSTGVTVSLSRAPADPTFGLFASSACNDPLDGGVRFGPGVSTGLVFFKGQRAGTFSLEARAPSLTSATATGNTVTPGAPNKLVFVGDGGVAKAGACTSPFALEVRDSYDNLSPFAAPQRLEARWDGGRVEVGQSACTGGVLTDAGSVLPVASGLSTVSFTAGSFRSGVGRLTMQVMDAGLVVAASSLTVTPSDRVQSVLSTDAGQTTDDCWVFTVTRRDEFGNAAPPSALATYMLSSTPNFAEFFSGRTCTLPTTNAAIAPPASTAVFSARLPRAIPTQELIATNGTDVARLTVRVDAGAPNVFLETPSTGSLTLTAGGCSPVTLARQDVARNDVPYVTQGSLSFTTTGGVTVSGDSSCTGAPLSTIPAGQARTTAYVGGTSASTGIVRFTLSSTAGTAPLNVTVNAGSFSTLAVLAPAGVPAITTDSCVEVRLERRDGSANPVNASSSQPVVVPASVTAYSDASCSTPVSPASVAGSAQLSFFLRPEAVGSLTPQLTLEGVSASVPLTVSPGALAALRWEALPTSVSPNTCSGPFVVRRVDRIDAGITTGAGTIDLTASANLQVSTSNACGNASLSVPIGNGSPVSDGLYAKGFSAGPATVSASVGSVRVDGGLLVVPGAVTQLAFLTDAGTVAVGACSAELRLEARDVANNAVTPVGLIDVGLSANPDAGVQFFVDAGCQGAAVASSALTSARPVGSFSFRSTVVQPSLIVQSALGLVPSASQVWSVTDGAPSVLAWSPSPANPLTRYGCDSAGRIETRTGGGDAAAVVADVTVALTVTASSGAVFYSDAACTLPVTSVVVSAGSSLSAPLYVSVTGNGPAVFTGSASGFTDAVSSALAINGGNGSVSLGLSNTPLEAGACVAVPVERRDASSALLTRGSTEVTLTSSTPAYAQLFTTSDCSGSGSASVTLTLGPGASSGQVFVKGLSAPSSQTVNLDAVAGATGGDSETVVAHPLVRRGSCNITGGQSTCVAHITTIPGNDISRSMLFFSSTGRGEDSTNVRPSQQAVECHLASTSADVEIRCARAQAHASGQIELEWQVASYGRNAASGAGITVQHVGPTLINSNDQLITIAAVDTARSFVLTSNTADISDGNNSSSPSVHFNGSGSAITQVIVEGSQNPDRQLALQVVTLGFAGTVEHVVQRTLSGAGVSVAVGNSPLSTTFALVSAKASGNSDHACKRRVNTKVGVTDVSLHRGNTAAPSQCVADPLDVVAVQRIASSFFTVDHLADVTFTTTETKSPSVSNVVLDRSLAFLQTQGPGGQTGGEGDFFTNDSRTDDTSPFNAKVQLQVGSVSLTRVVGTNSNATFSPVVVRLAIP